MHQPAWNCAEKTWYNHNGAICSSRIVATKEKRIFLISWRLESAEFEWHCPICPAQQTKWSKQALWRNNYGIAIVWNKFQYSVYGKINWNAYNNVSKILQSTCSRDALRPNSRWALRHASRDVLRPLKLQMKAKIQSSKRLKRRRNTSYLFAKKQQPRYRWKWSSWRNNGAFALG